MNFEELISKLNIQNIYWVDDEHASIEELDVDTLCNSFKSIAETADDELLRLLKKKIETHIGDSNTCRRWFKNGKWTPPENGPSSFDHYIEHCEKPKEFLIRFINFLEGDIPNQKLVSGVSTLISSNQMLLTRSFNEWSKERDQILGALGGEEKLLLLLDLNNAKEQCFGVRAGEEVLSQVAGHANCENVYILVLTSQYPKDQELSEGRRLTERYSDNRPIPLFVISKRRNLAGELQKQLAEVLSRLLLVIKYAQLKGQIERIYTVSIEEAFKELKLITMEEFVYKIAKASNEEGIPEIDSMLRVISGTARTNLQEALGSDPVTLEILSACRSLDAEIEPLPISDDSFIQKFTGQEHYENHLSINKLLLPIQVGDVFTLSQGTDSDEEIYYLLLGNFCFTALRKNGVRKDKSALLFPITPTKPDHNAIFELKHFKFLCPKISNDQSYFVDFSNPKSQYYLNLDLCWTNPNGNGCFDFSDTALDLLLANGPLIRSQQRRIGFMANENTDSGAVPETQTPKFDRIGRLTKSHALKALHVYSRFLSDLPDEAPLN